MRDIRVDLIQINFRQALSLHREIRVLETLRIEAANERPAEAIATGQKSGQKRAQPDRAPLTNRTG
jgi:hypothetical protein